MMQACNSLELSGEQRRWDDETRPRVQLELSSGSEVVASGTAEPLNDSEDGASGPAEEWSPVRKGNAGGAASASAAEWTSSDRERGAEESLTMATAEEWSSVRDMDGGGLAMAHAEEWSPVQEVDGSSLTTASAGGWSPPRETDAGSLPVAPAEEWSPIREPVNGGGSQMHGDHRDSDACVNYFTREEKSCDEQGLKARDPKITSLFVEDGERSPVACDLEAVADEPPLKRKKLSHIERDAVVRVTYSNLTSESRKALRLALQNWSQWHLRRESLNDDAAEAVMEDGTEIYSSALTLTSTQDAASVFAWMDKPAKSQETEDACLTKAREREIEVPMYDRACVSVLSSLDSTDCVYGNPAIERQEVSRCFNCGSYSHSLKKCSRPHDATNIRNARNQLLSKKGSFSSTRYYESSPSNKFDDLKPGILGIDTRQALGIGELDPPPWLNRMREIGYPPGYILDVETDSSGVEIIGESTESALGDVPTVDAIPAGAAVQVDEAYSNIQSVSYPGINAPIPENADEKLWAYASPKSSRTGEKRSFAQMTQVHDNNHIQYAASGWMKDKANLSNDPARYWFERRLRHVGRVDVLPWTVQTHGTFASSFGATPGSWGSQQATAQLSGLLPSPGVLPSPGGLPHHGFSEGYGGRSYGHQFWQRSYSQTSYATDSSNNEAWQKAETALKALKPADALSVSPPGAATSTQLYSESSRSSHGSR